MLTWREMLALAASGALANNGRAMVSPSLWLIGIQLHVHPTNWRHSHLVFEEMCSFANMVYTTAHALSTSAAHREVAFKKPVKIHYL